jgi:hypothetical protein
MERANATPQRQKRPTIEAKETYFIITGMERANATPGVI